jgi:transposase
VALTYRATVDVAARFRKAVGVAFGLRPSKDQSGERDPTGRISRCGDEMMRSTLYEAAQILLFARQNRPGEPLQSHYGDRQ